MNVVSIFGDGVDFQRLCRPQITNRRCKADAALIADVISALKSCHGQGVSRVQSNHEPADHGGGIDAARATFGGAASDWIDLSTGINPVPYPVPEIPPQDWMRLPDLGAQTALNDAARAFWNVPEGADVLAAPGASALIARIPALAPAGRVKIETPTYNEHGRAFLAEGWALSDEAPDAAVVVHPNNPDGRMFAAPTTRLSVIDESFCDVTPGASLITHATRPGVIVLKGFGKFWGLAGLRLGFAMGDPALIARLRQMMGPWPVSGPALTIATRALQDHDWTTATRHRLAIDARRLDDLLTQVGAGVVGGTDLFRLYDVGDAAEWQTRLAKRQIWSRIFPYSSRWLRLGLPGQPADWSRLQEALRS